MKNLVKTSLILLALVGMLFTSCKKEYEIPPINDVPFGDTLSIGDILAMSPQTTFDTASVCGIVTGDEVSGNLYKVLFIQDRATGQAIEILFNSATAARIGDSVRICLDKSIMYNPYHNLPQLTDSNGKGISPDGHLVIFPYNNPIEPKTVTIAEIKSGQYIGALVKLDSVEFFEKNTTFCEVGETTNRHLVDATNPNSDDSFVVRTSNYANFAYDYMPISKGSLVAIASIYNTTYQLLIRSKNEMQFSEWGGPATPAGELQSMPYTQSFASDFGTYMIYDVEGPQGWTIDYSTAKMTGYANSTNYANEDWLISSPVAVTGVDHAKVAVAYVAQYQNSDTKDVTLQVSTDYEYGKNPTEATWKQMDATYPNTSGWQDFQTLETSLDEFIGQNITVAIKFTSTESQSRTMEVQSITVQEGEAGTTPPGPTPGPTTGSGTQDDPYDVASGIALQGQEVIGWVRGYIVGAANAESSVSSNSDVDWGAPFTKATNVLIADAPTCQEVTQCIIVNLPSGKPLRTQVNLVDNPGNLGKMLSVNGKLRTYFGQAGLRDSGGTEADFELEGGTPTPPPTPVGIFSETFANGQGDFTIQDVVMPSELTFVWSHDASRKHMKASAYVGHAYETESWLVSPSINLAGVNSATLSFEQAVNYASPTGALSVMISTNYTGDVTTANWTELNMSAWPAGSDWTFITSTTDLAQFVGQTVNIAFKYTSTANASCTWEVKNVVVE